MHGLTLSLNWGLPFARQPAPCEALNGGSTPRFHLPNLISRHVWPCATANTACIVMYSFLFLLYAIVLSSNILTVEVGQPLCLISDTYSVKPAGSWSYVLSCFCKVTPKSLQQGQCKATIVLLQQQMLGLHQWIKYSCIAYVHEAAQAAYLLRGACL